MRKSLLLYLFVFAILFAIFLDVTSQKMLHSKDEQIEALENEVLQLETVKDSLYSEVASVDSFSLVSNEEALSYLESRGFDPSEVIARVEDNLISRNMADADNNLIPYAGMEGFFRINNVKLLNHKWAIANFTDGTYWGDIFVSFEIDNNGNLEVQTEKAVLYPRN